MAGRTTFRFRRSTLLIAFAFAFAACGTTTTRTQQTSRPAESVSPAGPSLPGGGVLSTPEQSGAPSVAEQPGPSGPGSGVGGSPGATTAAGGVKPAASSTGGRPPAMRGGHGVSDTKILVGLPTTDLKGADTTNNSQTGSSAQFGNRNLEKAGNAVIAYINGHGGVAGRKLQPVWFHIDPSLYAAGAEGRQQVEQSACAQWTEDNHVFAVVGAYMGEENMLQCMANTKTVFISDYLPAYISNKRFAELHDLFYAPHFLMAQRRERALVDALWKQGFFNKGAKLGALVEDNPGVRAGVNLGMKPALRSHGLSLETEIVYRDGKNAPWATYAYQLKSKGVTHVLMSGTTSGFFPTLFFMQAAEAQEYTPRYGIATDNQPLSLRLFNAPRRQMAHTQGMGWLPLFDIGQVSPQSDVGRICESINKNAGQPAGTAEVYCEGLFFLKSLLDRASVVGPAGMAASAAGIGDGFHSVYTIGGLTRFSNTVHDGPAQYRDLVFDSRCGTSGAECFKYQGSINPLR